MSSISINLQAVLADIRQYAVSQLRDPAHLQLLAVSKTFPVSAILEAAAAGQTAFGENYVQEAVAKIRELKQSHPELALEWHFIGPIQSNKTRLIAEHFDWVHTLDRLEIAQRLSRQRPSTLAPLNVCIQVNISDEASKSGVAPTEVAALARQVAGLPGLKLRGLMCIPAVTAEFEQQCQAFRSLRLLSAELQKQAIVLDSLSMGMSADYPAAIAEGSTIVRIGSAIFGKRDYAK